MTCSRNTMFAANTVSFSLWLAASMIVLCQLGCVGIEFYPKTGIYIVLCPVPGVEDCLFDSSEYGL